MPQASLDEAAVCKASYHMGAILDVTEKACEAIKEVSACAHHGQCAKWGELNTFKAAFDTSNPESTWKVSSPSQTVANM